jgi:hypothetical protein
MSLKGVINLQRRLSKTGAFVPITNCARVPLDYGIVSGVTIQEPRQLQAHAVPFSHATFADRRSPIAYGYTQTLPFTGQAPLFQMAAGGGGGGGAGGGEGAASGRPSGRGTLTDRTSFRVCAR